LQLLVKFLPTLVMFLQERHLSVKCLQQQRLGVQQLLLVLLSSLLHPPALPSSLLQLYQQPASLRQLSLGELWMLRLLELPQHSLRPWHQLQHEILVRSRHLAVVAPAAQKAAAAGVLPLWLPNVDTPDELHQAAPQPMQDLQMLEPGQCHRQALPTSDASLSRLAAMSSVDRNREAPARSASSCALQKSH
jgi:hypothetical protein